MKKVNKVLVPTYQMETNDYNVLLKLVMGLTGTQNINGLRKSFFTEVSEADCKKSLKRLEKRHIIAASGEEVMISEGVKKQLDTILTSDYCLCFQNKELKKKDRLLMFYYAGGSYTAVMSDDKKTILAGSSDPAGAMHPFEKLMLAGGLSETFSLEKWKAMATGKFVQPVEKPVKSCIMALGSNRSQRQAYSVTLVADKHKLQILRGSGVTSMADADCETTDVRNYYGVILRELERLREENLHQSGEGGTPGNNGVKQTREKTDYEKITESAGFPKSGAGFVGYTLVQAVKSIPSMVVNLFRKKLIGLVLFLIWSLALFLYNMYATCYINDTFQFSRRAVWGNLTPYLMAGQITTPSPIYGFNLNLGTINTVFLAAPLMLVFSYFLHHIFRHLRARKLLFFPDVVCALPGIIVKQFRGVLGKQRVWGIYAAAFTIAFVIMNPITILLLGILLLMIYSQGRENPLVQYVMLASCAGNRKKVDAGKMSQPTMAGAAEGIGLWGEAFLFYSLVNLGLWKFCQYNFYLRLAVTAALVVFCIMQAVIKDKSRLKTSAAVFLASFTFLFLLSRAGIIMADDGGITESGGTIMGLLHNAGFSTILFLSIASVGFFVGGAALVPILIGGAVIGGGVFVTGLTDTKAGDYVRKSANQFYDGVDKGDSMTLLCSGTKVLDLVTGFLNPAGGLKNSTMLAYHGMKLTKDAVSALGDVEALYDDTSDLIQGDGSVLDVSLDAVGLFFDGYGIKGDIGDMTKVSDYAKVAGNDGIWQDPDVKESFTDLKSNRDQAVSQAQEEFQNQAGAELNRHHEQVDSISEDLNRIQADSTLSEAQKGTQTNILNQTMNTETDIHSNTMDSLRQTQDTAVDAANDVYHQAVKDKVMDAASDVNDYYNRGKTVEEVVRDGILPNINGENPGTPEPLPGEAPVPQTNEAGLAMPSDAVPKDTPKQ